MSLWSTRTLLKARWHTFSRKSLIEKEFSALIRYLEEGGCTFHSCSHLGMHPVPRGVSFRYDVHLRDLPGAFVFAELHDRYRIPATFFLFWDYSPDERSHLRYFLRLRNCIAPPLEIGLHDSPVDAHLLWHRFGGDLASYAAWLRSADVRSWLLNLSQFPDELQRLNSAALDDFKSRVAESKRRFGPIQTVAGHGGEFGQELRGRMGELGSGAAIARSFFSRHWLTQERVRAAGLKAAVDNYGEFSGGWFEFSCRGGAIASLAENIRRYLSVRNSAIQLLLHPYTWTGAERDAEFSQALFLHGSPSPMPEGASGNTSTPASNPFWNKLHERWREPPTFEAPVSQLCTVGQLQEREHARLCGLLKETPRLHRKQWEFAYIVRCVEQAGALGQRRRGLGWITGREKLLTVFIAQGCKVVAVVPPGQIASEQPGALLLPNLAEPALVEELIMLRQDRLNAASSDLPKFDFCWSSSMASHVGSLDAGLEFMERSLEWLKPGGVAVHTLEFNLESAVETVRKGPVVVFREADLERFATRLSTKGHEITLNLHPGTSPDDLRVEPHNRDFHLKLYIQNILATSAGICIRKSP